MAGVENNPFSNDYDTHGHTVYCGCDQIHDHAEPVKTPVRAKDPAWKMVNESVKTMSKLQASYETVKNRCVSNMVEGKFSPKSNDVD